MFGENFEVNITSYTTRRAKFYKLEKSVKSYVDDGTLQIYVKESPPQENTRNRELFKKLLSHYNQKKKKGATLARVLDKSEFQREFTHLQDTYKTMMNVKDILKNAYDELIKQ